MISAENQRKKNNGKAVKALRTTEMDRKLEKKKRQSIKIED